MLWAATINSSVVEPSEPLLVELQRERRLTVASLGNRLRPTGAALRQQRARTDAAHAAFASSIGGTAVRFGADDLLEERVAAVESRLSGLKAIRKAIDTGRHAALPGDGPLQRRHRRLLPHVRLRGRVRRQGDRQGHPDADRAAAGLAGVPRPARTPSWPAPSRPGRLHRAGAHRLRRGSPASPAVLCRGRVRAAGRPTRRATTPWSKARPFHAAAGTGGPAHPAGRARTRCPSAARTGEATAEAARADLEQVIAGRRPARGAGHARSPSASSCGCVLAGGLGLLAVIASIVVSITTARALVRQLERLRDAALELADERLPAGGGAAAATARRSTSPPRRRRWTSATTRSARSARRSTRCSRPPSGSPSSRPSCAAASATSSSTSPGAARPCCTASSPCSTRWSGGPPTPRSWRTCSASTTWPPGCAATPRT